MALFDQALARDIEQHTHDRMAEMAEALGVDDDSPLLAEEMLQGICRTNVSLQDTLFLLNLGDDWS